RPWAVVERAPGGAGGAVDVLGVALGDAGEHLAGGRIERLERLARCRLHPFPVDQHAALRRFDELLDRRLDASGESHDVILPRLMSDRFDGSTGRPDGQSSARQNISFGPGRGHSTATRRPVPEHVMNAVRPLRPPKQMLVVSGSPVATCSSTSPNVDSTVMPPFTSVATQTLPSASTASESK